MAAIQVSDRVWSVGVQNPLLRVFDVVMVTEYGTTYNSWLVRGRDKTVLIDTSHAGFFPHYLQNIRAVCDPAEIDYIILNHCEPDHSGVLERLLPLCPKAAVLASRAGTIYLPNIANRADLPLRAVKDGETLDLGDCSLRFIIAPFLHWPDSMFTFLPEEETLFSCDFLGCHYCEPHVFDTNIVYAPQYEDALRYYYNAIFAPFAPHVRAGLDKIRGLPLRRVCVSHGPVLSAEGRLPYVLERYGEWSAPVPCAHKNIPVFYATAYGNTRRLAEAIREGILEALPEAQVPLYQVDVQTEMADLRAALNASDAFAVGSPTINADAVPSVWELLSHADAVNSRKKPALVFGSYGWSGEAVPNLTARLQGLKMAVFGEGLRAVFVPSQADLEKARTLGREFGASLAAV